MKNFYLLFALPFVAVGCSRQSTTSTPQIAQEVAREEAKAAKENLSGLKGAVMKGGELRGGDSQGRPLWSLAADEIRTSGSVLSGTPKQAVLVNARATLYRAGKAESSLRAPEITLFNTPQGIRLTMTKGFSGQSVGPWTGKRGAINLSAPRADVDVKNRVISATGGVKMSQGAVQVTGQTLRAATSMQSVNISGGVRAKAPNGDLEAKTASYDWKNARLQAQTVTATREKTKISGQTLEANTDASRGYLTGGVNAQGEQGSATAPRVDFDWKRDQITARSATFNGKEGQMSAAQLQTDSKLRVASASGLVAQKDGATLRADFANGFDGLSRIQGRGVSFSRADLTLSAPRADARKVGNGWVLVASGGATGKNASGSIRASRVTWDENRNRVDGNGVTLEKDGATLSGSTFTSDTKFENARLSGNVRGRMRDGSTLQSGALEKRGERIIATRGATARFNSRGALGVLTLVAPSLEASADGSTATASQGVTVKSASGAWAKAPKAVYNRAKNQITATGGVDFYDPKRGLEQHGDSLVADLGLKQVNLTNVRGQGSSKLFEGKKLF